MKRLISRALLLAVPAVLAGCAVGPTYQAPVVAHVAPAQWVSAVPHAGSAQDLVRWWDRFDDASLTALMEAAQQRSPTLEQAVARVRQARAALGVAQSGLGPAVSGQSTAKRVGALTSASAGLETSWELDLFGGRQRATEASAARAQGATALWHQARVSLAAEVASTYFSYRQCRSAVELAQQDLQSREKTLELVLASHSAGATAMAEVLRARASALESQGTLRAQQGLCQRTELQLVLLTALPAEQVRTILAVPGLLPEPALVGFDSVPAQVLAQRPDVAAAERSLAAASADIGVATADLLPSLTLFGAVGINASKGEPTLKAWSFGPSLSLPVFDNGRRRQSLEAAHGRYDEARGAWRQTVLQAVQETEDALTRLDTAQARVTQSRSARQQYEAYFKASTARFEAGAIGLLELEDARRLALASRQTELSLSLEHAQARVALYRAAGGGWTNPLVLDDDKHNTN